MNKFGFLLLSAVLLTGFWSCESPLSSTSDILDQVVGSRGITPSYPWEVTLISYQVYSRSSPYLWDDGLSRKVQVIVKNLGTNKTVGLWAKNGLGVWEIIPAVFVRSVNSNTEEIWEADFYNKTTVRDANGSISLYNSCLEYAIKYTVGDQTYWDNNNGKNYTTESVGPRFWVLGKYNPSTYYSQASISALVKNLTLHKKVTLIYSTDNWTTTKTLPGVFGVQVNPDYDSWSFPGLSFASGTTIKYAIAYDPQGYGTIWDNNFGENYTLRF